MFQPFYKPWDKCLSEAVVIEVIAIRAEADSSAADFRLVIYSWRALGKAVYMKAYNWQAQSAFRKFLAFVGGALEFGNCSGYSYNRL